MTAEPADLPDLKTALAAVYHGPLEEFVQRRDSLAKQLRADRRREDADTAKALRKPSRTAWALDNAVHDDPVPVERLAAAISAAVKAQSAGSRDLRAALDGVRTCVRDFADAAASCANQNGYRLEATALVPAITAVMGDAGAFADLRAGQLAEIPEGGSLDFLTAAPPARAAVPETTRASVKGETDQAKAAAQSAELDRAQATLLEARERSRAAQQTLEESQRTLDGVERQLRQAQEDAITARNEIARAREQAKLAAAQVVDAERAVQKLQLRIVP